MRSLYKQHTYNSLTERIVNNSVSGDKVSYFLEKLGFKVYSNNGYCIRSYITDYKDAQELDLKFNKAFEIIERCGWTCAQYGGYYDGLRNQILSLMDMYDDVEQYGTYCLNIEADYNEEMDNDTVTLDDADMKEYLHPYSDIPVDQRLGIGLEKNIFWHITKRKYLRRIMKYGLLPKNGHEITNWRNTKDRIYLSLLPNFNDIDEVEPDEEDGEDSVQLRIDITHIAKKIKFYRDYSYENAVFTYTPIPPQCIEVYDTENRRTEYFLRKDLKRVLEQCLKYNSERSGLTPLRILKLFYDEILHIMLNQKYGVISQTIRNIGREYVEEIANEIIENKIDELL